MLFPDLPDDARVWTFTSDRALSAGEADRLLGAVRAFLPTWASHGRPVPADATVLYGRFLVVAAHLGAGANAGVSGCGIDQMTRAVEEAATAAGIGWLGGLEVAYRDGDGGVQTLPRSAFRRLARSGDVDATTPVFDTTAETLGGLRQHGLERPASEAWHGRVFPLAAAGPVA